MNYIILFSLLLTSTPIFSQTSSAKRMGGKPLDVVERFHASLATGDSLAVARLLGDGAAILESGEIETRKQYLAHHLTEDFAFAKSTKLEYTSKPEARISGNIAWVSSAGTITGNFNSKPIHISNAELMVLTRMHGEWKISAIHWSSHRL